MRPVSVRSAAHLISLAFNPGFLVLALIIFGISVSPLADLARLIWYLAAALAAGLAAVILLVTWAHGVVVDVDLLTPINLRDRSRLVLFFLALLSFLLIGSYRSLQPEPLHSILITLLVLGLAVAAITWVWKISLHMVGVGTGATALFWLYGLSWWPIIFLVPLVAWSRLRLHRHTPLQLLGGLALGMATTSAIFWWAVVG